MLLSLLLFAFAQTTPATDDTMPPAGAVAVETAQGRGVQVYHCEAQGSKFEWAFDSPSATLYLPGTDQQVGTHTVGPSWTWNDGSSITGTVAATKPSPQSGDLPWLLLKTKPLSITTGTLGKVSWVRRSDTSGGAAPTGGCDAQHQGALKQVPYTATYTFYKAKSAAPTP